MVSSPYLHPSGTHAGKHGSFRVRLSRRWVGQIPPSLELFTPRRRTSSSSLNGGGGSNGDVLGLLGGSLSGLGGLVDDRGLQSGSLRGGGGLLGLDLLSLVGLGLGLGGSDLLIVELDSLAVLAEETAELVGLDLGLLALTVGNLSVRGLGLLLLLAEGTEEGSAALVLEGGSLGSRDLDLLSGLLSGGDDSLGLNGLDGSLLNGVLELGSGAGDGLLSGGGGLLLGLLLSGAGNLLEEVAEDGGALVLLLLLLLFLLLLLGLSLLGGLLGGFLGGLSSNDGDGYI